MIPEVKTTADTYIGTDLKSKCERIAVFLKFAARVNLSKSNARSILNHFQGKWCKENLSEETGVVRNIKLCIITGMDSIATEF